MNNILKPTKKNIKKTYKERLDKILCQLFPKYSRSFLKDQILKGKIKVNNIIICKPKYKISKKEKIETNFKKKILYYKKPEKINLKILYEDKDLIILNKQKNLVVHPGKKNKTGTLLNALINHYPPIINIPKNGIIHRLDKNTTGIMIIAKNIQSMNQLTNDMKLKKIKKIYEAIVHGKIIFGGTINKPLYKSFKKRYPKIIINKKGKKSITHYRIIKQYNLYTHISIKLETGRTHQIRAHMNSIKHPILGDQLYSFPPFYIKYTQNKKQKKLYITRQSLHSKKIILHHPKQKKILSYTAPLPKDILKIINILEKNF